jgi:hypothetical protein
MMRLTINRVAGIRILALGAVLALMVMAAGTGLAAQPAHASTTFTVNSTGDKNDLDFPGGVFDGSLDGKCFTGSVLVVQGEECTLRAAIQQANKTPGADTIEFDIPGTGVATIAPASELPVITGPVTVNGYSQPGAKPNAKAVGSDAVLKIMLSGAKNFGSGLQISAANSTVKGLVINQWSYTGVRIDGSGATGNRITGNYIGTDPDGAGANQGNSRGVYVPEGSNNVIGGATPSARNVISNNLENGISIDSDATGTRVLGNYIGTDASGTQDFGNAFHGINIEGSRDTVIGGATAGERNVISGNQHNGVSIGATGVKVLGNYIGTDASGTQNLGNASDGVSIGDGQNNTVGGATAAERNVISGNGGDGVLITGGSEDNRVMGNYVGTGKTGATPLGNSGTGVNVFQASGNTLGGTTAGARNVISANGAYGVVIEGFGPGDGGVVEGNKVMGNYVGTDASGTKDLGNAYHGVYISGAPSNTIGGTQAGERNVISGNGVDGVRIFGDTATGNRVLSNSIFANGEKGIDLGGDGPTLNDPADADNGPNDLQNFPVITSARTGDGKTTVRGTLNSTPDKTFRVQLFSSPAGADEGKKLIGQKSITTDAGGNASFIFSPKSKVEVGRNITATATGPGGDTSEFSVPKKVVRK